MDHPRWVCTDVNCTEEACVSYKQLAIKGPPICTKCRRHMGISQYELRKISKKEKLMDRCHELFVKLYNHLRHIIPSSYGCLGRGSRKHSFVTELDCPDCMDCEKARKTIEEAREFPEAQLYEYGSMVS